MLVRFAGPILLQSWLEFKMYRCWSPYAVYEPVTSNAYFDRVDD